MIDKHLLVRVQHFVVEWNVHVSVLYTYVGIWYFNE